MSVIAPDVQAKRTAWKELLNGIDQSHLIYLDECGVNTNMTRIYGRSIGKTRVIDHAPLNTPKRRLYYPPSALMAVMSP